jgi:hypothetical protein
MGCLFSIFRRKREEDDVTIELGSATNAAVTCKCGVYGPQIKTVVDPVTHITRVEGSGTALGSCALDCDTGYWEVKLGANPAGVTIGVKRYNAKKASPLTGSLKDGGDDNFIFVPPSSTVLKAGDVVGVYWDQTDLPMLNFTVNGIEIPSASIMRIRPAQDILPAISLDAGTNSSVEFIFDGNHFCYPPKSGKFKMIVCATSLI